MLARRERNMLLGTRLFLSAGPSRGAVLESDTVGLANELARLGVHAQLLILRGSDSTYRKQFVAGLRFAFSETRV